MQATVTIPANLGPIQRLRMHSAQYKGIPFVRQHAMKIERDWSLPITGQPASVLLPKYREKLQGVLRQCDDSRDLILMSTEGIGKTTTLMSIMASRAFCLTVDELAIRFSVFACRSIDQAKAKAQECAEKTGMKTLVIQSFWTSLPTGV